MDQQQKLPIWDIWIRLFHWSLALAVLLLLYTGLTGEFFYEWHRRAGEFVLFLILFRICWGLVGSSNARLSTLVKNPLEAFAHLRSLAVRNVPIEREHNAAGAWAVLVMLLVLGIQALSGMFIADEDEFVEGALYGSFNASVSDWIYSVHMFNAELIKIIVALHVFMIAIYLVYAKRNLILPMITGKLAWPTESKAPTIRFQHWWVGLLCLLVCALGVAWLGGWY